MHRENRVVNNSISSLWVLCVYSAPSVVKKQIEIKTTIDMPTFVI